MYVCMCCLYEMLVACPEPFEEDVVPIMHVGAYNHQELPKIDIYAFIEGMYKVCIRFV